jgi:Holliday junction resolvase RusA-like endonuclease
MRLQPRASGQSGREMMPRTTDPASEWTCTIPGKPRQKGNSKRAFVRGGRAFVVPGKGVREAEDAARLVVAAAAPRAPFVGAVEVTVTFVFAIPKSRRELRIGDPHTQDPDRGNLLKLVEDAMAGLVYVDDNQVCGGDVSKVWGARDETVIVVRRYIIDEAAPAQRR